MEKNSMPKLIAIFVLLIFFSFATFSQNLNWSWVNASHGWGARSIGTLFITQDSTVYTNFSFFHHWKFDSVNLQNSQINPADADLALWKLDKFGRTEWAKSFKSKGEEVAYGFGHDQQHNLFAEFQIRTPISPVQFDSLHSGNFRLYFDESGNWKNVEEVSSQPRARNRRGQELWLNSIGTGDTLFFGLDTVLGPPKNVIPLHPEMYLAMVDENGNGLWGGNIGTKTVNEQRITRFINSNKIVLGSTIYDLPAEICHVPVNEEGIYWSCYDNLGNCFFQNHVKGLKLTLKDCHESNDGNFYLMGSYDGFIQYNGHKWNSHMNSNLFLIKIDSIGQVLWVQATEGHGSISPEKMVIDQSGNIIIGGQVTGVDTLETYIIGTKNANDIFLCAYTSEGNFLWAKGSDTQESQNISFNNWGYLHDLAIGPKNQIYVLGAFYDNMSSYTLGSFQIPSLDKHTIFIAALTQDFIKSLTSLKLIQCPIHPSYQNNHLLLQDNCPDKPIIQFNLYSITGQKIAISEREKLTQGYLLHPAQSLSPGIYILKWERRNRERGVKKFVVGTN